MPPKYLSLEGNSKENWNTWKENFTYYLQAAEYDGKADAVKSSLLLHCIVNQPGKFIILLILLKQLML